MFVNERSMSVDTMTMTEKPQRRTKAAQTEDTTRRLIDTARRLFGERGYANTATEEIVAEAGVTRGALYHHFQSKEGLLAAVIYRVLEELAERITAAANTTDDPFEQLLCGAQAALTAILEPDIRRIVYVDGSAVLDVAMWDDLDNDPATRVIHEHLERLLALGVIRPLPIDALVCMIGGALETAAQWIARSADRDAALRDSLVTFAALMSGLRAAAGSPPPVVRSA